MDAFPCVLENASSPVILSDKAFRVFRETLSHQSEKRRYPQRRFSISSKLGGSGKCPLNFLAFKDLNHIVGADVIVVLERHAAFLT